MGRTLELETPRKALPLLQPKRYKGLHGGRGSSKSHTFAEMALENSMLNDGYRVVCIREIQKSLEQSSMRLLTDKIKQHGLEDYFTVYDTSIVSSTDGIFIFQGMQNHTADSIKSLEGYDLALLDEAQRVSDKSWRILYPTIRKPRSEIWAAWNPFSPKDPVDKFFRGPEAKDDKDILTIEMNWRDNPWFMGTPLYNDMLRDYRRDPEMAKHVWDGGYMMNSEARVFRNWRIDTVPRPNSRAVLYSGADWGFATDPTVLVVCYIDTDAKRLYIWREAYKVGCEIDHTPTLFDHVTDREREMRGWPITADSARPETISYMKRNGYARIRPARKGPGSIEEGINFLKDYDIIVDPSCVNCIDELTSYAYKVDPLTGLVLPVLDDKKNHVIDAIRYAIEPIRKPKAGVF